MDAISENNMFQEIAYQNDVPSLWELPFLDLLASIFGKYESEYATGKRGKVRGRFSIA